jgi:gliding motility-associated protein GldC
MTSSIHIQVTLNEERIPEHIDWSATDLGDQKQHEAKAMLLAFFDKESKDTLKIDLWTKEMQVMEMDLFFYQTLRAMTETYQRATSNTELVEAMQQFVRYFGQEVEVLKKD